MNEILELWNFRISQANQHLFGAEDESDGGSTRNDTVYGCCLMSKIVFRTFGF